ncbi:MAG: outer membrane protein assembly factor BamB family protein, partial [Limisphaerales bacterium]
MQRVITLSFLLGALGVSSPGANRDWPVYLGDAASSHHSELKQINRKNVHQLEVAWTYHAGDGRKDNRSQIQCNPIIIDGILYGTSPQLKLLAIDAATGTERWRFDPFSGQTNAATGVNRGVVFWKDGKDRRILFTAGHRLYCINADSGEPVESFGSSGTVDIRAGLGRDPKLLFVLANTPGALYRDLLILGTRVSEGPGPSAPGHIRAYDVRSGKIVWTFRTIPQPGEPGYTTWPPDAYQQSGGANVW